MQNQSPLLRDLRNYYDRVGILSTNFKCVHLAACKGCLPSTPEDAKTQEQIQGTFTEAKSAFVGDRYGECAPRLLFVSLDPGSALTRKDEEYNYISNESRLPEGVQKGEMDRMERVCSKEASLSPRLRATNRMAACLLGKPDGCDIIRFYAHINAVKCTTNKKGRRQADDRLFYNCRGYLREEIEVLSPDVIISLGLGAKRGIEFAFSVSSEFACEREFPVSDCKRALWLPIHHTSSPAIWPEAREKWGKGPGHEWEKFAERVRGFMSGRDS